jgi:hypothetical protein
MRLFDSTDRNHSFTPDPWHVESNALVGKADGRRIPEWGRAGLLMTYPASWTAFDMRAPMSRNPFWHQARQSSDRAGEQAYLRGQSQNRESARRYRSPGIAVARRRRDRMSRSLPKLALFGPPAMSA